MKRIVFAGIMLTLTLVYGCGGDTTGPGGSERIDLTVYVTEEDGTPLPQAVVSTIPPTQEITTDPAGRGTFVDIVRKPYFFVIDPPGRPTYQYYLTLEDADTDSLQLRIVNEPPQVDILFPLTNSIVSSEAAILSGSAIDHEEGPLPDSLLVWEIDNTGEAGRGRSIEVNDLSPGTHVITLTGYDSEGGSTSDTVTVTAGEYSTESYFPVVPGAEWLYTHNPVEFTMYNHQQILERWTLENVTVRIDDAGRRISTMEYNTAVFSSVRYYQYRVIDDIVEVGESIMITGTTEELRIWRNSKSGQADEYLRIETDYEPAYTILTSTLDPGLDSPRTYAGGATVDWTYIGIGHGTTTFVETPSITVSITTGDTETAVINRKNVETVPVTITIGDAQRKWWLARGFGIAKFQYNTFSANPVATLVGTNLAGNESAPLFTKPAIGNPTTVINVNDVPESGFDHLRAVRNVLQRMAP